MILCHLQQSSGCLGCFIRPPVNTSASNLSKELGVPGRSAGKRSISEDFWTTSTCDMDNSAVQSQGSISSLGTNNLIPDTNGGSGSASAPSEFTRQRWIGNKKAENRTHQVREPKLKGEEIMALLMRTIFACRETNMLKQLSIVLNISRCNTVKMIILRSQYWQEMVDFLVDIWEQEGMYD
ncbi:hypothetical protein WN943_022491 [Citrus x changshan-huyou]